MEAVLNPEERMTASKFFQEKDRQNFIIRRAALRILLAGYLGTKAREIAFIEGENKKPLVRCDGCSAVNFNLSHSGDCILIGVSDNELGVDIEHVMESFNYQEMLNHVFNNEEKHFITSSDSPAKNFFKLWTRKEALIKATSKGVDDDLNKIPGLDGSHQVNTELLGSEKNWNIKSFSIEKTSLASIAHSDYNSIINFFNFPIANYLTYH